MTSTGREDRAAQGWRALAAIGVFAVARLLALHGLGLGADESYTIAVSRRLDWSYLDHPPLHQWIAHYSALMFGEGVWARLPFIALFAATGWLVYVYTRENFDARAAWIALVGLNLTPFFFVSAGAWVVPDGPLLFALAAAAIPLGRLVAGGDDRASIWRRWLAAGFWLGLAGLSKYNAILTVVGLAVFVSASPRQRRWLTDPAAYAGAAVAIVLQTPVLIWNAERNWASFWFQTGRAVPEAGLKPLQPLSMMLGQIGYLTPWIFAALAAALIAALRSSRADDEQRRFLACLSLAPILVLTIIPLWGDRGFPHWAMPGWFFAYPLMGAWLADRPGRWRPDLWAWGTAALLGFLGLAAAVDLPGYLIAALHLSPRVARDPVAETLDWTPLRDPALSGGVDFFVATDWRSGGKLSLGMGRKARVFVFSDDPRGLGAFNLSADFVGRDGLAVVPLSQLAAVLPMLSSYFASLDPPRILRLEAMGGPGQELALVRGRGLTHGFPLAYPH